MQGRIEAEIVEKLCILKFLQNLGLFFDGWKRGGYDGNEISILVDILSQSHPTICKRFEFIRFLAQNFVR